VIALPWKSDASSPVLHGSVEDGHFTNADNSNDCYSIVDSFDRAAIHEACWKLANEPQCAEELLAFNKLHSYVCLSKYQEQYFDYPLLKKDLRLWMLEDPFGESEGAEKSKTRILNIISESNLAKKEIPPGNLAKSSDIFGFNRWQSRTWMNGDEREEYRFRSQIDSTIDKEKLTHLFWWVRKFDSSDKDFPSGQDLESSEAIEKKILSEFETKKLGVLLVSVRYSLQKWIFLIGYTHDPKTSEAEFRSYVGNAPNVEDNLSFEDDPEWKVYFDEVAPKLK